MRTVHTVIPLHSVGEAPAVARLVVVADEEDAVVRRGKDEGEPQLCPVDVLDLVDQQVRARGTPPGEDLGSPFQEPQCPRNEVVEVQAA